MGSVKKRKTLLTKLFDWICKENLRTSNKLMKRTGLLKMLKPIMLQVNSF
jgi:hypothetical protein